MGVSFKHLRTRPFLIPVPEFDQHVIWKKTETTNKQASVGDNNLLQVHNPPELHGTGWQGGTANNLLASIGLPVLQKDQRGMKAVCCFQVRFPAKNLLQTMMKFFLKT